MPTDCHLCPRDIMLPQMVMVVLATTTNDQARTQSVAMIICSSYITFMLLTTVRAALGVRRVKCTAGAVCAVWCCTGSVWPCVWLLGSHLLLAACKQVVFELT